MKLRFWLFVALVLAMPFIALAQPKHQSAAISAIAGLIDPAKLATLRERGANPRVQKYTYWLAAAKAQGDDVKQIAAAAVVAAGYTNALARQLTADTMLRNLDIAGKLGCLDEAGTNDMRHGRAPTIRNGPYKNDQLSVDHIIPLAVAPQLGNVIANLEFMPQRMNSSKQDKMGDRQRALAKELRRAGLLNN